MPTKYIILFCVSSGSTRRFTMVKTPEDLRKINDNDEKKATRLESVIDECLEHHDAMSGAITISTDFFSNYSSKVREYVLGKYRAAGWNIKYIDDWRDGDYYEFQSR